MIKVAWEPDWPRSGVRDTVKQGETADRQRNNGSKVCVMTAQDRMVAEKTEGKRWTGKKFEKDH